MAVNLNNFKSFPTSDPGLKQFETVLKSSENGMTPDGYNQLMKLTQGFASGKDISNDLEIPKHLKPFLLKRDIQTIAINLKKRDGLKAIPLANSAYKLVKLYAREQTGEFINNKFFKWLILSCCYLKTISRILASESRKADDNTDVKSIKNVIDFIIKGNGKNLRFTAEAILKQKKNFETTGNWKPINVQNYLKNVNIEFPSLEEQQELRDRFKGGQDNQATNNGNFANQAPGYGQVPTPGSDYRIDYQDYNANQAWDAQHLPPTEEPAWYNEDGSEYKYLDTKQKLELLAKRKGLAQINNQVQKQMSQSASAPPPPPTGPLKTKSRSEREDYFRGTDQENAQFQQRAKSNVQFGGSTQYEDQDDTQFQKREDNNPAFENYDKLTNKYKSVILFFVDQFLKHWIKERKDEIDRLINNSNEYDFGRALRRFVQTRCKEKSTRENLERNLQLHLVKSFRMDGSEAKSVAHQITLILPEYMMDLDSEGYLKGSIRRLCQDGNILESKAKIIDANEYIELDPAKADQQLRTTAIQAFNSIDKKKYREKLLGGDRADIDWFRNLLVNSISDTGYEDLEKYFLFTGTRNTIGEYNQLLRYGTIDRQHEFLDQFRNTLYSMAQNVDNKELFSWAHTGYGDPKYRTKFEKPRKSRKNSKHSLSSGRQNSSMNESADQQKFDFQEENVQRQNARQTRNVQNQETVENPANNTRRPSTGYTKGLEKCIDAVLQTIFKNKEIITKKELLAWLEGEINRRRQDIGLGPMKN